MKALRFFKIHLKRVQPVCALLLLGCIEPPPSSEADSPIFLPDNDKSSDMGIQDATTEPDKPDQDGRSDMWEPVEPGPEYPYPEGREPDLGPPNVGPVQESDMDENGR